jgi:hypothetical protein
MRRIALALALSFALGAPRSAEAAEICDEQGVCIDGAKWASGEQLDDKARAKERKKHAKRKDASLTVELRSGRGSVFVDGVWIAPAPISFVPIKPGKHDIEIRDGETLLARGIIDIPKTGGEVTFTVGEE